MTLKFFIKTFFLGICFFVFNYSFATDYQALAPIADMKQVAINGGSGLSVYLNNIYILGISLCTGLAVLMIVIGGIEYMGSGSWSGKDEGKERIKAALLGLLVALGSYVILNTLDTRFLNTELDIKQVTPEGVEAGDNFIETVGREDSVDKTDTPDPIDPTPTDPTGPCDPTKTEALQDYVNCGRFSAKDHSGRTGTIAPQVAYLKKNASTLFSGLGVYSDYRSPEHNATIPGAAKNSDHTRGNAVDIWNPSSSDISSSEANKVIDYVKNNSSLGATKMIYNNTFYYKEGGQWTSKSGNYGHQNHVHISF